MQYAKFSYIKKKKQKTLFLYLGKCLSQVWLW